MVSAWLLLPFASVLPFVAFSVVSTAGSVCSVVFFETGSRGRVADETDAEGGSSVIVNEFVRGSVRVTGYKGEDRSSESSAWTKDVTANHKPKPLPQSLPSGGPRANQLVEVQMSRICGI